MFSPLMLARVCFVFSGAASLGYQLLWVREAISYFGIVTPIISIVLAVFMLGLAFGNAVAGRWAMRWHAKQAIQRYILVELVIAASAVAVPLWLGIGFTELLHRGTMESTPYLLGASGVIALSIFLPCFLIGTTLPIMMRVLQLYREETQNFGSLYFANMFGAFIGCFLPLLLIEYVGIQNTLYVIAACNGAAACVALRLLGLQYVTHSPTHVVHTSNFSRIIPTRYKVFLFLTGFVAIGGELLWVRAFAPVSGNSVYAFSAVLGLYIAMNALGNWVYLRSRIPRWHANMIGALPIAGVLIIGMTSYWALTQGIWPILAIAPIAFMLGYLVPSIIGELSGGNPQAAAQAYGYNVLGCILGPICTGYMLFPLLGLKLSLGVHAILLFAASWLLLVHLKIRQRIIRSVMFALVFAASLTVVNYEDFARNDGIVLHDHIGYVAATGQGMQKRLTVNGVGVTVLSTAGKNMLHLPAVHHAAPKDVLIICMGMGTTLRSAMSWPFRSITMVELSEAVSKTFSYFHRDAAKVLRDPRLELIIDDGRRFLLRTKRQYDIISIDPPPPLSASGSAFLYSADFMKIASESLKKGGIFALWKQDDVRRPEWNHFLTERMIAAMQVHFRYIKILRDIRGVHLHILASNEPMPQLTAKDMVTRLPQRARTDLAEYLPHAKLKEIAAQSLQEVPVSVFMNKNNALPPLSDNFPYNEFFLLRAMQMAL